MITNQRNNRSALVYFDEILFEKVLNISVIFVVKNCLHKRFHFLEFYWRFLSQNSIKSANCRCFVDGRFRYWSYEVFHKNAVWRNCRVYKLGVRYEQQLLLMSPLVFTDKKKIKFSRRYKYYWIFSSLIKAVSVVSVTEMLLRVLKTILQRWIRKTFKLNVCKAYKYLCVKVIKIETYTNQYVLLVYHSAVVLELFVPGTCH